MYIYVCNACEGQFDEWSGAGICPRCDSDDVDAMPIDTPRDRGVEGSGPVHHAQHELKANAPRERAYGSHEE